MSYFEDIFGFGRTSGGFNIKQDLELFAWGTSTVRNNSLDYPVQNSADISGGVYGIIRDRSFVYIATKQSGKEFQIYSHDFSTSTVKYIPLPVAPKTLTCDGDDMYVLAASALVIYKISFK